MKIPLTRYGRPQVFVFPVSIITAMVICGFLLPANGVMIAIEAVLAGLLVWVLSFFRDPQRAVPTDKNLLLAPADGTITDIETVEENDFLGGPALKIGIFLSIFDAHINRSPCDVRIEKILYKKGHFKNARNLQSGRTNESNDLYLIRTENPRDKLIVRQISGAIARRIVCQAKEGQNLTGGEKFGMIKFGSRTELYLPLRENAKCLVRPGDKVKAGLTALVRYL